MLCISLLHNKYYLLGQAALENAKNKRKACNNKTMLRHKLSSKALRFPSILCFFIVVSLLYSAHTLLRRSRTEALLFPMRRSTLIAA